MKTIVAEAKATAQKHAQEGKLTVEFEPIWHAEPILFDEQLVEDCNAAVEEETGEDTACIPHRCMMPCL